MHLLKTKNSDHSNPFLQIMTHILTIKMEEEKYPEPPVLSPVTHANSKDSIKTVDEISTKNKSDTNMPPLKDFQKQLKNSSTEIKDGKNESSTSSESMKKDGNNNSEETIKKGYQFHLKQHHVVNKRQGQKVYKCDICSGEYRHAFSLKRHFLRSHINYKYLSDADISNCNISINCKNDGNKLQGGKKVSQKPEQKNSNQHIKVKKQITEFVKEKFHDLYRCHICGQLFKEKNDLKYHIINHPPSEFHKQFSCAQCYMTFSHKQNLVRHYSVHSAKKGYSCKYCRKFFPSFANQKKHERIHEGLKPFQCIHCSAYFSQSSDMRKHVQKNHAEFYHPCFVCSKLFSSTSDLEGHVSSSHFEKIDATVLNLKRKQTLHSGYEASDSTKADKEESMRLGDSSTEMKYACTVCRKRFTLYVNMCRHRRLAHHSLYGKRSRQYKAFSSHFTKCNENSNKSAEMSESCFYLTVAQKISDNLLNFVDGRFAQLNKSNESLKNDQQTALIMQNLEDKENNKVSWSSYNFPPDFDICKIQNIEVEDLTSSQDNIEFTYLDNSDLQQLNLKENFVVDASSDESQNCESLDEYFRGSEIHIADLASFTAVKKKKCYEQQLVGKQASMTYVCCACSEKFTSLQSIEDHKINNHPNVYCTHMEIENNQNIPPELCMQFCSPFGALRECAVPPPTAQELKCTKCGKPFSSVSDLHQHILDCGKDSDFKSQIRHKVKLYRKKGWPTRKTVFFKYFAKIKSKQPEEVTKNDKVDKIPCNNTNTKVSVTKQEEKNNELSYKCEDCESVFKNQPVFERHKQSCILQTVSKRFRTASKDQRQMRRNICPHCSHSFLYVASLKKHIKDGCPNIRSVKKQSQKKLLYKYNNSRGKRNVMKAQANPVKPKSQNNTIPLPEEKQNNNISLKAVHLAPSINDKSESSVVNESHPPSNSLTSKQVSTSSSVQPLSLSVEGNENISTLKNKVKTDFKSINETPTKQVSSSSDYLRPYSQIGNYQRHSKNGISPLLSKKASNEGGNNTGVQDGEPINEASSSQVKEQVEKTVINLFRKQSEQMQLMSGTMSTPKTNSNSSLFQTFSCIVCHKIFLSYFKMLQHRLSHKLQSDEPSLSKMDLGLMNSLAENTAKENSNAEQQQKILSSFENILGDQGNEVQESDAKAEQGVSKDLNQQSNEQDKNIIEIKSSDSIETSLNVENVLKNSSVEISSNVDGSINKPPKPSVANDITKDPSSDASLKIDETKKSSVINDPGSEENKQPVAHITDKQIKQDREMKQEKELKITVKDVDKCSASNDNANLNSSDVKLCDSKVKNKEKISTVDTPVIEKNKTLSKMNNIDDLERISLRNKQQKERILANVRRKKMKDVNSLKNVSEKEKTSDEKLTRSKSLPGNIGLAEIKKHSQSTKNGNSIGSRSQPNTPNAKKIKVNAASGTRHEESMTTKKESLVQSSEKKERNKSKYSSQNIIIKKRTIMNSRSTQQGTRNRSTPEHLGKKINKAKQTSPVTRKTKAQNACVKSEKPNVHLQSTSETNNKRKSSPRSSKEGTLKSETFSKKNEKHTASVVSNTRSKLPYKSSNKGNQTSRKTKIKTVAKTIKKDVSKASKDQCRCTVCGKTFACLLFKNRHCRLAHKNKKQMKGINRKEERLRSSKKR